MQQYNDTPSPLIDHILELRQRLIYAIGGFLIALVICYFYSEIIFDFLVQPLSDIFAIKGESRRLIYTSLTEAFLTYFKVAAFAAAFITFPFMAFQLWLFIAPGLYHRERKLFLFALALTPVLFLIGSIFAYYVVLPNAYTFFLSFEHTGHRYTLPVQLEAKINEYLSFVIRIIFAFGLCFELPILLTLMASIGKISSIQLVKKWRIAVFLIVILAAVITPPDILSMVGLIVPLVFLYSLSILMVKCLEQYKIRKAT